MEPLFRSKARLFPTLLLIAFLITCSGTIAQTPVIQANHYCTGATLTITNNPQIIKQIRWIRDNTIVRTWTWDGPIVAGTGIPGSGLNQLSFPVGLYLGTNGTLTVAETNNHRIIQFPPGSTQGTMGFVVAGGNGAGTALNQLYGPYNITRDGSGNLLVADALNNRVLRFPAGSSQLTNGTVVVDGPTGSGLTELDTPMGLAVDAGGNIYVVDRDNARVLRFPPGANGNTPGTVVAGGNGVGPGLNQLDQPTHISFHPSGDLLIVEAMNHRIVRWTPGAAAGVVVAGGNGAGTAANQLDTPNFFYLDGENNLYISDHRNHRIQKWAPGATTGITVAGGNGNIPGSSTTPSPTGIAVDLSGNIYVATFNGGRIQKFAPQHYIAGQPGTYKAEVTLADNSIVTTADVVIGATTAVTIAATPASYTPGTTMTFTAIPQSGGATPAYQWKVNGNNTATSNPFVSATLQEGDIVTCEMTAPSACTGSQITVLSNSITLKEKKKPTLRASSNCSGGTLRINAAYPLAQIKWYRDNVLINTVDTSRSITTFAGGNGMGAGLQQFNFPQSICRDKTGNIYVADHNNHRILKFPPGSTSTTNGTVVAGGNGQGLALTQMRNPIGVALDGANNLYVVEYGNHRVMKFAPGSTSATPGTIVAGGNGDGSAPNQLSFPFGIALDDAGNIFVADYGNYRIMRFPPNGTAATAGTIVAGGNGSGTALSQCRPTAVALNARGDLLIADDGNQRILQWLPGAASGTVVAGGNGSGSGAHQMGSVWSITLDEAGNQYLTDLFLDRLQLWQFGAASGVILAGNVAGPGPGQFDEPAGIVLDSLGNIWIADRRNHRIQHYAFQLNRTLATNQPGTYHAVITAMDGSVTTTANIIIGNAQPPVITISTPFTTVLKGTSVTFTAAPFSGGSTPVLQWKVNGVNTATGNTFTSSTLNNGDVVSCEMTHNNACAAPGPVISNSITMTIGKVPTLTGSSACPGSALNVISQLAILKIEWYKDNNLLGTFNATWNGTTIAGGNGAGAVTNQFNGPFGLFIDHSGDRYVADYGNNRVLKFPPGSTSTTNGVVVAGGVGAGSALNALFNPVGLWVDGHGNLYVSDYGNHRVIKFPPGSVGGTNGQIVAGNGVAGAGLHQLNYPTGISLDGSGNLYVADRDNHRVLRFPPGSVSGTAGTVVAGGNGAGAALDQLNAPNNLHLDAQGNLLISEIQNARIVRWAPGATTGTLVAGGNGTGPALNQVNYPNGMVTDVAGNLFITDRQNHRVMQWQPGATAGTVLLGGNGAGNGSNQFNLPIHLERDGAGNFYVTDYSNHRIQQFTPALGPTFPTTGAGTYKAVVTTIDGMTTTTGDVVINAVATPAITITSSAAIICAGSSVTFTAATANAGTTPAYQWKLNGNNVTGTGKTYQSATLQDGDVVSCVLTPSADAGCIISPIVTSNAITLSVTPSVTPAIVIDASFNDTCTGTAITFTALSSDAGTDPLYQWQVNGATVGRSGSSWTTAQLNNGDQVNCVLFSNATCATNASVPSNSITMELHPTPTVSAGPDKTMLQGDQVLLEGSISGTGSTLSWTPATGLQNAGTATPVASPATTTSYRLEASTSRGCKATDEVVVTVLPTIKIPNAFSPNRDGIHDTWEIPQLQHFPQVEVLVFNRYGQQVYTARGYQPGRGWNGTLNGYVLPAGTYYYVIDLKNGRPKLSGSVTLIK
jgi:gliding motility-associated-like protein